MKKFFFLKTCDTCRRIRKELALPNDMDFRDLKDDPIDSSTLEKMYKLAGSYSSLLNKRSKQFRAQGWHEKDLDENMCKEVILSHYTLLKRPILIWGEEIFVGNSKKTIAEAFQKIHSR